MKPLRAWPVVLALMVSIATPWTLLQSAAWLGMLVRYSQEVTLSKAVELTFDGKHPCRICHFVREGKSQERHEPKKQTQSEAKLQLSMPPEVAVFFHPPPLESSVESERFPGIRPARPPTPPPRG